MILDLFVKNNIQVFEKGMHHLISFIKGISWRLIGTIDTILIFYLISGNGSLHSALVL